MSETIGNNISCGTCKHWRFIADRREGFAYSAYGECMRIQEHGEFSPPATMHTTSHVQAGDGTWRNANEDEAGSDSSLLTSPEFGCTLYEANRDAHV